MYVSDLFNKFKKRYLNSFNKKDYDTVQYILSQTQLFDLTHYSSHIVNLETSNNVCLPEGEFYLPFKYCFINTLSDEEQAAAGNNIDKFSMSTSMFLREETPTHISGIFSCKFIADNSEIQLDTRLDIIINDNSINLMLNNNDITSNTVKMSNTFNQKYEDYMHRVKLKIDRMSLVDPQKHSELTKNFEYSCDKINQEYSKICELLIGYTKSAAVTSIVKLQRVFNKLSKCDVLVDKCPAIEYYKRKNEPTIKINNRPIYYIMRKGTANHAKPRIRSFTDLEYTHAFRVRGHWRRIPNGSIGKDRYNNYHVLGYTWVMDHIRGQGELVDKVRIIK